MSTIVLLGLTNLILSLMLAFLSPSPGVSTNPIPVIKNLSSTVNNNMVTVIKWRTTVGLCVGGVQNSCRPVTKAR